MSVENPGATGDSGARPRRKAGGINRGQHLSGWAFVSPFVIILVLFMVVPIFMAAWVSVSNWTGKGSPFLSTVKFVGTKNYKNLVSGGGLSQQDFATSIRNTFYFVLLVVPIQTILAMGLAILLNSRRLKAKSFFRSAYYFPSVTSSVAIALVFTFLFAADGTVNAVLGALGLGQPGWFSDARGTIHLLLSAVGVHDAPGWAQNNFFGIPIWEWIAGPSVGMCTIIALVIWVSAGGYMLMFLANLQAIPEDIHEAAMIDGASTWQRIRYIVIPNLRATTTLVVMLGVIGTWQVFDQVYIMSQGAPGKTTLSPAYLSYSTAFNDNQWGQGTAISFLLFALIIVLTIIQRTVMSDRSEARALRAEKKRKAVSA